MNPDRDLTSTSLDLHTPGRTTRLATNRRSTKTQTPYRPALLTTVLGKTAHSIHWKNIQPKVVSDQVARACYSLAGFSGFVVPLLLLPATRKHNKQHRLNDKAMNFIRKLFRQELRYLTARQNTHSVPFADAGEHVREVEKQAKKKH